MAKLTIAIRADGSKKIGMGHISPMITLARELKRKHFNVVFITFSDPKTLEVLTKNHLPFKTITHPKAFSEIKKIILKLEPRLIINNTWQNESREHFAALKSSGSKIIGFYQTGLGLRECDVVINPLPSSFVDEKKVRGKYFFGPEYIIFSKDSRKIAQMSKKIPPQITNVVLAIGGTDKYDLTPRLETDVKKLLPQVKIDSPRNISQLDFLHLIHNSDLLITGGATTIFEAAFLAIPTIGVAQEQWEKKTILYAVTKGVCLYGGFRDEIFDRLEGLISDLNLNTRMMLSNKGKKLVDGKGLGRVIAIIKDLL